MTQKYFPRFAASLSLVLGAALICPPAVAIDQAAPTTSPDSIIQNGSFETIDATRKAPAGWGKAEGAISFPEENGNRFLRLKSTAPGKMEMLYREIDVPADTTALQMTWKYRLSEFKKGKLPWYDASFIIKCIDASGNKLSEPSPSHSAKNTKDWTPKTLSFLVPEGTAKIIWMPALFQVQRGTFDIDDVTLTATDPAPLLAAKALREEEAKARRVEPETVKKENWPLTVHVQGNRLVDPSGKEVWLQGVNAGGLESLPNDDQMIKSAVVAIDDWKANVIRLPVNETFWFGRDPRQKDGGEAYRAEVDQIITLVTNRSAYVALDLHRYRAPKAEHAEFWKDAAAKYKDHPGVLFDLFNEPHNTSWDVWQKGGWVDDKKADVDESAFLTEEEKKANSGFQSIGMQGLLDAVRSTGAKNVVIVGGLAWAGDLSGVVKGYALSDTDGNGIMYSWHQYNWHKGWARTVLPVAEKYPVLAGEIGCDVKKMDFIPEKDQEDPYTWAPDMIGFLQKNRINYTAWCLHPRATPVLISDWKYTPTPFWGVFVKDALSGKQFEMKKMR